MFRGTRLTTYLLRRPRVPAAPDAPGSCVPRPMGRRVYTANSQTCIPGPTSHSTASLPLLHRRCNNRVLHPQPSEPPLQNSTRRTLTGGWPGSESKPTSCAPACVWSGPVFHPRGNFRDFFPFLPAASSDLLVPIFSPASSVPFLFPSRVLPFFCLFSACPSAADGVAADESGAAPLGLTQPIVRRANSHAPRSR